MVAVSFYYLKSPAPQGKLRLICQLASTAYRKGHKVYVHAVDEAQSEMINQTLWTFASNSFVPHTLLMDNRDPNLDKFPVVIGSEQPPEQFNDVLISLQAEIPSYVQRFQRVAEPVDASTEDQSLAKTKAERYRSLFDTEPKTYFI